MQLNIKTPLAMRKFGAAIAAACLPGTVIYLHGDLGAGKTTLVRGFMRGVGYPGHVKSPTFNLFELYQVKNKIICHFDLYRLRHPEEIVYIGALDYFNDKNICLIEWPEHGGQFLPAADLVLNFSYMPNRAGRLLEVKALTSVGKELITKINRSK